MKILLVDDDVFLRDMYATKFKEHGDEVHGVASPDEALRLIATDSYDLVLTDMVMPGMTGSDLIEKIKALEGKKELCCIVLSNQGEESDISEATKKGADGYIIKAELIPSEVVDKVHTLIS